MKVMHHRLHYRIIQIDIFNNMIAKSLSTGSPHLMTSQCYNKIPKIYLQPSPGVPMAAHNPHCDMAIR